MASQILKSDVDAVLEVSWDDGPAAIQEILSRTGWTQHPYSRPDKEIVAAPQEARGPLRILVLAGGKLEGVMIPSVPKGDDDTQIAQAEKVVSWISDASGATPSATTDGEDRWVWEWDDRNASLLLDDEGLVLKVFRKGTTPFSE